MAATAKLSGRHMVTLFIVLALAATLGRFTPYIVFPGSRYVEVFPIRAEFFEAIRLVIVAVFSAYWLCALFRPSAEIIAGAHWLRNGRLCPAVGRVQGVILAFSLAAAVVLVWHACIWRVGHVNGGDIDYWASVSAMPYTLVPWVVFTPVVLATLGFSARRTLRTWRRSSRRIPALRGDLSSLSAIFLQIRMRTVELMHPHVQVCLVLLATLAAQRIISNYGPEQADSPQMSGSVLLVIWIGHMAVAAPSMVGLAIVTVLYMRRFHEIEREWLEAGASLDAYAAAEAVGRPTAVLYAAVNRHPVSLLFAVLAIVLNVVTL